MCADEGARLGSGQRGVKVGFDSIMATFSVRYANHMTGTLVCGVLAVFTRLFWGRLSLCALSVGLYRK